MKELVGAFNQEKALVGAFSVITNLRMELFQAVISTPFLFGETCNHPQFTGLVFILLYVCGTGSQRQRLPPPQLCTECTRVHFSFNNGARCKGVTGHNTLMSLNSLIIDCLLSAAKWRFWLLIPCCCNLQSGNQFLGHLRRKQLI